MLQWLPTALRISDSLFIFHLFCAQPELLWLPVCQPTYSILDMVSTLWALPFLLASFSWDATLSTHLETISNIPIGFAVWLPTQLLRVLIPAYCPCLWSDRPGIDGPFCLPRDLRVLEAS